MLVVSRFLADLARIMGSNRIRKVLIAGGVAGGVTLAIRSWLYSDGSRKVKSLFFAYRKVKS